jgi:hypothetical protein
MWSRGSSVIIVSWYGLDDRAIEVLSSVEAKAWPEREADQTPSSAEAKNEQQIKLLSPQAPSWRVVGQL